MAWWRATSRRHRSASALSAIKGNVVSSDVDCHGTLGEKAEVKDFLLVRAGGRVEGRVTCGDVEVEKGAVLAGGIFSSYDRGDVKPVNDNAPAARRGGEAPGAGAKRTTVDAAE